MDLEHERRLSDVEGRSKDNTRRIEDLEERQDKFDSLNTTIQLLAEREKRVEDDVGEIKSNVKSLINKPGQRWDNLIDKIVTVLVAAIVGFILGKIGL